MIYLFLLLVLGKLFKIFIVILFKGFVDWRREDWSGDFLNFGFGFWCV